MIVRAGDEESYMALAGIRVIDLTDERGIYGTKLLADLGAQVIRPEGVEGDPLRKRGPFMQGDGGQISLWHSFFARECAAWMLFTWSHCGFLLW